MYNKYFEELKDVLPPKLLASAISLSSIGVNAVAWNYEDSIEVINIMHAFGRVILGGDVYKIEDNEIKVTYDSWHYDPESKLHYKKDVENSRYTAIDYISKFIAFSSQSSNEYIFDIVIR